VTGAAGKTGLAVVGALVAKGEGVRALVRRKEVFHRLRDMGAREVVVGDMRDPEFMAGAAAGARAEIVREKGTNRAAFLRGEVDKYTWVAEGSSYILSDVLAALLDAQLDKFDEIQARRARVVARYREGLAGWARANGVRLPPEDAERTSNHHLFALLLPDEKSRDACLEALRAAGVQASFHYVPLHSAPHGRALGLDGADFPVTDRVARTLLRLPLHPLLTGEEVERVLDAVRAFRP